MMAADLNYHGYSSLKEMWSKKLLNLGSANFDMDIPSCYDDRFVSHEAGSRFNLPFVCVINKQGFTGANPTLGFFRWGLGTYSDTVPKDFHVFIQGE